MAKMDSKLRRDVELGRSMSIGMVSDDVYREKTLAENTRHRDFRANANKEMLNKGITWYESGLTLEDADETDRNNMSFINGYNIAKRRELAKNLKQENHKSR